MPNDFTAVVELALSHAQRYLERVGEQRAFPGDAELKLLDHFDEPLPQTPSEASAVIEQLALYGSPNTVASMGGRYFGFVTGGVLPAALGAKLMGTAWDQNNGARAGSPVAAKLEEVALGWLIKLFGLPPETTGAFVTGASMANFSALVAARHALVRRMGWNAEEDGLFGAPEIKVVVSEESHSTVFKALQMVGFGRNRVHKVPTDAQGRMRTDLLPELDGRTLVCLQAGNVNSGAFDGIAGVCAKANGAWIHVDGAFGLWAATSPKLRSLVEGLEQADSWATDGHKWLNTPYDCGIVFVRDAKALRSAFVLSNAPYLQMQATAEREPLEYTPEASRRARGIEVWAALKQLGRQGVQDLIEGCCERAEQFAAGFRAAGLEVPHEVFINQVMVGFGSDERTQQVIKAVQADGTLWAGGTVWKGRTYMRLSCSSWRTVPEDVQKSLEAILRIHRRLP